MGGREYRGAKGCDFKAKNLSRGYGDLEGRGRIGEGEAWWIGRGPVAGAGA